MREVSGLFPKDIFPDNYLPSEIADTARLVVKCSYAKEGRYAASLMIRGLEGRPRARIVIENQAQMQEHVDYYKAEYTKIDGVEPNVSPLGPNDMCHAYTEALNTLIALTTT